MRLSLRNVLGVNRFVLSPQEYKRVLLTGQLNLVFMAVLLAFTIMDLIWDYRYPIPYHLAGLGGGVVVYLVNRTGYFLTARILLTLFVNALTLYFTAMLDRNMGLFQFAIPINIGILAVFNVEKTWIPFLLVILFTLLYMAAMFHPYPRVTSWDMANPAYLERNLLFSFIVANVASVLVIYYLLRSNHASEATLLKKEQAISLKNQELREVNAELDRFFYSVSHDLRAPLTSLQGLLSLLETAQKPEEQREYVNLLRGRVENLDHFVKTITSYAGNARQSVRHEPVNLRALFREILENVRFYPHADSISFILDITPYMEFHSDPTRLQIILGNLVSNAIKYHDTSKPERWIKISEELAAERITLRIEDNGIGIPKEVLPRVFDMFYRGHEHSQGSGLGLYIVKEAVEKLGGSVSVASEYGQGSVFTVALPITRGPASSIQDENGKVS